MSELLIYINGEYVPQSEARISVFDSAFNFGDMVFEGIRVYNSRVYALDEHIERLYNSAKAVMIEIPLRREELRAAILKWLRANDIHDDFHFRPIVTRGNRYPPRTSPLFVKTPPNVVFVGGAIGPAAASLRMVTASIRRLPPDVLDPKIKSGNFLNNILAKLEALRQGADDALMYDTHGFLAESSAGNVFLVRRGVLYTPLPKSCLEGITQTTVIEIARDLGYALRERDLTPVDVYSADEAFMTGTAAEVTPIVEVDGRTIGAGKPGPVVAALTERFAAFVRSAGVPIYEG